MKRRLSVGIVIGVLMLAAIAGRATPVASSLAANSANQFGQLLWLPPAAFDPVKQSPRINAALAAAPESDLWVAQLDISRGMQKAQGDFFAKTTSLNATVLGYLPEAAYLVRVSQPGAEQLRAVSRAVVPFHPAFKISPQAARASTLTVVTLPDANAVTLARQLQSSGATATASSNRIAVVANRPGLVVALAYDARVLAIEPQGKYQTFNTDARWVTQSTQRDYTPLTNEGLTGTNESVAVADTGSDYYPDPVGQANYYFSDCTKPLAPTTATCKLADYTYEATAAGNLQTGAVNAHNTNHRKMLAYFDEVGDGDPAGPNWQGDSGSSTHGSHTSASIAGSRPVLNADGTVASYPGTQAYDGQAPKAKLVFQDIGTSTEGLNGLPGDLYQLFDQAYDVGQDQTTDNADFSTDFNDLDSTDATTAKYQRGFTPRVHSNSWGSFIPEVSLGNSPRLDDFVVGHEDFLPVFAAGNSGPDGASIGEPGTAKDALTVGATANGRADYASLDTMANFSSHGAEFVTTNGTCPTGTATPIGTAPDLFACPESGAIKPDVATPGLHMISAKGGTDTAVQVLQGTSMATPTAAGDAVLVRQYFDDGFGPAAAGSGFALGAKGSSPAYNASAALVKAVMIASAQRMRGFYTGDTSTSSNHQTDGQWPSTGQGWGRVQLDSALHFKDIANSPQMFVQDVTYALGHSGTDGVSTGEERTYSVNVGQGQPLRVVLDWSDPGGLASFLGLGPEALTNHLQLRVDGPNGPSNAMYCGNNINTRDPANAGADVATSMAGGCAGFVTGVGGSSPFTDNFNNVQVVYLPSPAAGTYTIRVQGLLVAQPQNTIGLQVTPACTPGACRQGFAIAATGNLSNSGIPGTIAGTPLPSGSATVTSFSSKAVSGDATVLRWTTDRRTTSAVTISGPGVGGNRTLQDDYSYDQSDFPGLAITLMETQGKNFLHVPVVSDHHELKLTGLQPGATYSVSISANGQPTGAVRSFRTPATSYAPQIASDTATLFSGPAGIPEPINDPTGTDPWGNSSQLYIGQLPPTPLAITPPVVDEQAIGAFKMVTPSSAPTTNLAGAAVLIASRHDITSHVQEMPATSLDLVQSAPDGPGTWGTGTGYLSVKNDPTLAHLFPNFGHLRTSALTWEPYTVSCNDLSQLTTSLSSLHMASFRASASFNKLVESVYGFESGFARRSTGLEYRPVLVLFPDNGDPLRQPGGTPHVSDVRVERQDAGTVVVYWQSDVAANSIVLVRAGTDTYQVGSPAYTKVHQVQLNGVALGATFAVRSASSTGQATTSASFAVPDAIVTPALAPPPAPALAQPASGSFATTPTHQSATAIDKLHGTGYGCAQLSSGGGGHEGDGGGDVQGDNGDSGHMSFDEDPGEDNDAETVQWHDNGSGKDFQSTQIQSVQFDDVVHSITVAGVGLNGGQPVTFLMQAIEATDVAPAWYSLTLSDGSAISGSLTGGTITLH